MSIVTTSGTEPGVRVMVEGEYGHKVQVLVEELASAAEKESLSAFFFGTQYRAPVYNSIMPGIAP
jgi:hypothetical protein